MKKFLGTSLALFALCSFMAVSSSYACDNDKTSGTASACCAKSTTATTASAKTTTAKGAVCSPDNKAACGGTTATATDAKLVNSTMTDCAKTCTNSGTCQFRTVSIKGMTCGGCEQSVQTALVNTPGVLKVVSVSYKTGTAVICVDPTKVQETAITTAVASKGFEAQVIPAVATTTVTTTPTDAKTCTTAGKGCCADKKAAETKETTASTENTKKPL